MSVLKPFTIHYSPHHADSRAHLVECLCGCLVRHGGKVLAVDIDKNVALLKALVPRSNRVGCNRHYKDVRLGLRVNEKVSALRAYA